MAQTRCQMAAFALLYGAACASVLTACGQKAPLRLQEPMVIDAATQDIQQAANEASTTVNAEPSASTAKFDKKPDDGADSSVKQQAPTQ